MADQRGFVKKARLVMATLGAPGWECRCDACRLAVSHGAPEEDRDYDAFHKLTPLYQELARAADRVLDLHRDAGCECYGCQRLRAAVAAIERAAKESK